MGSTCYESRVLCSMPYCRGGEKRNNYCVLLDALAGKNLAFFY